ncbi:COX15/CtaA family protein [Krasilnikoviella flava]|uniref:Cytochrome c oxidase assembly protein subunit 15 n=1 Tax=Krasilnikoviella flava TaxID=526729 RepID=A0A1T5L9I1_9MICO|nr:hypothetical protein [Krasilnikoviella flava]SKC72319.1 hypothetical protein SAMN04324258_3138 [Krasilnikoviella flava]
MRQVFRVLAYVVAAGVVVQAAVMVYAVAGMGLFIDEGGVLDQAAMEQSMSGEALFPEEIGLMLHGMTGTMVLPIIALLTFVASFFAGVRGAWRWGLAIFLLVALQVTLGIAGHSVPFLGALHGVNALLLFGVAMYTGWRVTARDRAMHATPALAAPGGMTAGGVTP